ncbi:hypothetical protein BGW37DRAFT_51872 [Umbelopsis sp. PMI_123]|nr:hypothetical protein BGW37DRAFT_51872 [Umbelopsis sp. PMI_123]
MYVVTLDAEFGSLSGDLRVFQKCYDTAIDLARSGDWKIEVAPFYELCGNTHLRQDNRFVPEVMLQKALSAYIVHGSYGKALQMKLQHFAFEVEEAILVDALIETEAVALERALKRINEGPQPATPVRYGESDQNLMSLDVMNLASSSRAARSFPVK